MSDLNCHDALERLYEYLDGELSADDARLVHHHLEICAACYPEVKLTTEFRDALQRAANGQPCCPEALRDRIAQLIHQEARHSP
jgi:mycothiol system anti-sigma-R factor